MPNVDLSQTTMNVWYAFINISESVLFTSILHQLSVPQLKIPGEKKKKGRKPSEVTVIFINKIWTCTLGVI